MDVIVLAPAPALANFVFDALVPNTTTMQAAITANLEALFLDRGAVGVPLSEDAYNAAIIQTVDPSTGDRVQSFNLTSPSGDIGGGVGEYPVFQGATYP